MRKQENPQHGSIQVRKSDIKGNGWILKSSVQMLKSPAQRQRRMLTPEWEARIRTLNPDFVCLLLYLNLQPLGYTALLWAERLQSSQKLRCQCPRHRPRHCRAAQTASSNDDPLDVYLSRDADSCFLICQGLQGFISYLSIPKSSHLLHSDSQNE